jgi:alanine dehydrogenase
MPGAVARTSTFALNNATQIYGRMLADQGWEKSIEMDAALRGGLNVCRGKITCEAVARAQDLPFEG